MFVSLAILASLAFGQAEKQEQNSTTAQTINDKYDLEKIERYRGYVNESIARFRHLAEKRTALYKELQLSIEDGDPVLVQKAVDNLYTNAYAIKLHKESQKRTSTDLQGRIEAGFLSNLIDKTRYIELRNNLRAGLEEAEQKLPDEYTKWVETAKGLIPNYFAHLKQQGEEF